MRQRRKKEQVSEMRTGIISALFILAVSQGLSAAPLGVNLLANPGFESDLLGWSTDHGSIRTGGPPPHGGVKYLMGGKSVSSYTFQDIDLLAAGFTEATLDSGKLAVDYGGWRSGWSTQTDSGKIEIRFKDAAEDVLSTHDLGWFYSNHTWVFHKGSESVPPGARSITYGFHARRFQGTNNDGYLDDALLTLTPEPTTVSLVALGGLAVVRRRKRGMCKQPQKERKGL